MLCCLCLHFSALKFFTHGGKCILEQTCVLLGQRFAAKAVILEQWPSERGQTLDTVILKSLLYEMTGLGCQTGLKLSMLTFKHWYYLNTAAQPRVCLQTEQFFHTAVLDVLLF